MNIENSDVSKWFHSYMHLSKQMFPPTLFCAKPRLHVTGKFCVCVCVCVYIQSLLADTDSSK